MPSRKKMKYTLKYLVHLPFRFYITTWLFMLVALNREIPFWLERYAKRERANENIFEDDEIPTSYRR